MRWLTMDKVHIGELFSPTFATIQGSTSGIIHATRYRINPYRVRKFSRS
jgi:hypothetical protein